jgi:hypothetical protein
MEGTKTEESNKESLRNRMEGANREETCLKILKEQNWRCEETRELSEDLE